MTQEVITSDAVFTHEQLLDHWQGHRRLTRKVIEAFPETELFTFAVGGMRPFAELVLEMYSMGISGIDGVVTATWDNEFLHHKKDRTPKTKEALLYLWDELTEKINRLWPQVKPGRFQETDVAFGQWEGKMHFIFFYWVDNEIHHRAQGYVYLRALGIEPPAFWDRS